MEHGSVSVDIALGLPHDNDRPGKALIMLKVPE